ncbi:MAG: hemin uptake protein HemP [Proteobacteria bacterium]|nr:hemin uptake protein HemP [Pseudomonadota bacterium]
MTKKLPDAPHTEAELPSTAALPVIDVMTLLGESREAILLHNGERYRLRITANNKLILTK